jgi:beta-lactamase class A
MTALSGLGTRRRRRSGLPVLPTISTMMLLGAIGLFVWQLITFSQQQNRLPADVSVAGVPVGGMLPGEARVQWERTFTRPVTLWYGDSPIVLDPAAVGLRINSESMLAQARADSEGGGFWLRFFNQLTGQQFENPVNVPLSAEYQENLLEQFLREISLRYDRQSGSADFDVQTLTLRPGAGGTALDVQAAIPLVDAALRDPSNRSVILPIGSTTASSGNINTLRDLITTYLDSQGFLYDGQDTVASIYIMDLQTGEEVNLNGDVAFSAASTVKVPILIDYFRTLTLAPTDEEAYLMANSLLCSNNASSNLIMQIIGGGENIFQGISSVTQTAQFLGARNTYLTAPLYLGVEGQELGSIAAPPTSPNPNFNTGADPYNQTTTEDLGTLFTMIYDCAQYGSGLMAAYPNGEFTQNECQQMIELMSGNDLLRLLQGGLPQDTRIAHKNGWLEDVHGDAGIVFPPNGRNYVISVFVWKRTPDGFFTYTEAWPLIEGISRAAWNYFVPESPLLFAREDLPVEGAQACDAFLPPFGEVNLYDIDSYKAQ